MLIRKSGDLRYSEITPKSVYVNRRQFLVAVPAAFLAARAARGATKLAVAAKSPFSTSEPVTSPNVVTRYNNFYEFGTDKDEPSRNAQNFKTSPWTVSVEGDCAKPRKFAMDEILKLAPLEERIYRHRCVEAWSIVVPWIGYSLSALLKQVEPTPKAKFVAFESYYEPEADAAGDADAGGHRVSLRGRAAAGRGHAPAGAAVRGHVRRDAAAAGRRAGAAGGAVEVRVQEHQVARENQAGREQPPTTWNMSNSHEYGFYSNVNPNVDHPRWSQAKERRLPATV